MYFLDTLSGSVYVGDKQTDGIEIPAPPSVQHVWVNGAWVHVQPVPQEVSRYQAIEALAESQILDEVEALMSSATTPDTVKRAWSNVQVFRRYSQMVLGMAALLNLSDDDLDNLFILAATIQA